MRIHYCILDYKIRRLNDVTVAAITPALLYGDSVFETLPVVEAVPVFLKQHLTRLNHSAEFLGYSSRLKEERIRSSIDNLLTGNLMEKGRLRITLFKGSPLDMDQENLLILLDDTADRAPCEVGICKVNNRNLDPLARHKTGNRLFFRHLYRTMPDAEEVLLIDESDRLLEGTVSNIFLVIDGKIYTPPREVGILPGIQRGQLLKDTLLDVEVKTLYLSDLANAEEAFLTNSLVGIRPVTRIGPKEFSAVPGYNTRAAMASWENMLLGDISPYM
jgi:branched-subunit amino acid aminotransferase/4-amino-4-deoxychorismate lyase